MAIWVLPMCSLFCIVLFCFVLFWFLYLFWLNYHQIKNSRIMVIVYSLNRFFFIRFILFIFYLYALVIHLSLTIKYVNTWNKNINKVWRCGPHATIWCIWKEDPKNLRLSSIGLKLILQTTICMGSLWGFWLGLAFIDS